MPEKRSDRSNKLARKKAQELDVKISFLEGLVRRAPEYIEALQILGDHYTERGDFQESLRIDQQLSRLEPGNPLVFYNLACSYSLNGDQGRAAAALDVALTLGYRDFKWLARDPDLRPLRQHPAFSPIKDKLRKLKVRIG
jgi:tetratricopeptide (TPR) repeat protein